MSENRSFAVPEKKIKKPTDMELWKTSPAYVDLFGFIKSMNDSVKGIKCSDSYTLSDNVSKLCDILSALSQYVDDIPPVEQPQRFGNKAFKTWFQRMEEKMPGLLKDKYDFADECVSELLPYIVESFGNDTRIDYGTGHELNFICFLCLLFKTSTLDQTDCKAVVLKVFEQYLILCRKLQSTYRMEPAGSRGVWSLDDFQFVPFIWGSSQFIGNRRISPKSFLNPEIVEYGWKDYIFLAAIKYINEVKTGNFAEHSNQLWNISGVKTWDKVNSGLLKMYKDEVLEKFPLIQHLKFGSLLRLEES